MADNQRKSREELIGGTSIQEQYSEVLERKEKAKDIGEITVKVNVDVSEALTGLKAIQREAREATKALRELEDAQAYARSAQSITDDIRRSYEIGGDGE